MIGYLISATAFVLFLLSALSFVAAFGVLLISAYSGEWVIAAACFVGCIFSAAFTAWVADLH